MFSLFQKSPVYLANTPAERPALCLYAYYKALVRVATLHCFTSSLVYLYFFFTFAALGLYRKVNYQYIIPASGPALLFGKPECKIASRLFL